MDAAALASTPLVGLVNPDYNGHVDPRAQDILRDALTLPLQERADVVAELLASLDDGDAADAAEVEAAWAAEIARRAQRVMAGQSQGTPWDEVRRRAEAALRKR